MSKAYGVIGMFVDLVYLSILWVLCTLCGLVIFGLVPATVALFCTTRKWIVTKDVSDRTRTFFGYFKREIWRSQKLTVFVLVTGAIPLVDFKILPMLHEPLTAEIMNLLLIAILILFGLTIVHLFPLYSLYNLTFKSSLKYALLIGLSHPLQTVSIIVFCAVLVLFIHGALAILLIGNAVYLWNYTCIKIYKKTFSVASSSMSDT